MAENRNIKRNTPVKKKRKLNAKGRKVVRRSVAGVLLASALIVASLPSDKSGTAQASITKEQKDVFAAINMLNGVKADGTFYEDAPLLSDSNYGLAYTAELANADPVQRDNNAPELDLAVPGEASTETTGWSLTIDNSNYVQNMYKYYEASAANNPSQKLGVICDHNRDLGSSNSDIFVGNSICGNYDFYSDTYYEDFLNRKYRDFKFVVFDPHKDCYIIPKNSDNYVGAVSDNTTDRDNRHIVPADEMAALFPAYLDWQKAFDDWMSENTVLKADNTPVTTYDELMASGQGEQWRYNSFTLQNDKAEEAFCRWHDPLTTTAGLGKSDMGLSWANVASGTTLALPHAPADAGPISERIYIVTDKRAESARPENWSTLMDEKGRLYSKPVRITGIGKKAFAGDNYISSVTLDSGVLYVGDAAFQDCIALTKANMKEVTFLGERVFYNCRQFKEVELYSNLQTIGNEAFANCQTLGSISIPSHVNTLGFGAFYNCSALSNVTFNSEVVCDIGDYAFYNTQNLSNVDFSNITNDVSLGKACFALERSGGASLQNFTFPSRMSQTNSYKLYGADVDLFESSGQIKGASTGSAVPDTINVDSASEMESLKNSCMYNSIIGDFLLANRRGLKTVNLDVLGLGADDRLPMNTFLGCANLTDVNIRKEDNYREGLLGLDANIFRDVATTGICVYGPKNVELGKTGKVDPSTNNRADYAKPRMCTWATYSAISEYVPYSYEGHYEVGQRMGDDAFLYDLKLIDDASAGVANCTYLGNLTPAKTFGTEEEPFSLPDIVANKQVVELLPGSLDLVKDNILYLEIPDNSLTSLGDDVFSKSDILKGVTIGDSVVSVGNKCFEECPELEKVSIGPGIINVGSDAFAKCAKLEDVYWEQPLNADPSWLNAARSIGANAFKTGADNNTGKLYFHGSAESADYAPFKYAMDPANTINGSSVHICYMSPVPGDMSVAENWPHMTDAERKKRTQTMSMVGFNMDGANKVMLIDYPRYEELPESLKNEITNGRFTNLSGTEQELVNSTRFVNVPPVVDSVDVKRFIDANSNDVRYIDDSAESLALYGVTKRQLYGGSSLSTASSRVSLFAAPEVSHPGLFSGDVRDNEDAIHKMPEFNSGDSSFTEASSKGNDWMLTVNLPRVEKLPDYCFDSCERLMLANLGEKLGASSDTIGERVFHGCDRLTQLSADYTMPNPYLSIENMILYRHDMNAADQELVACLSSRRAAGENGNIAPDPDSTYLNNVTSIKPGAFDGCTKIKGVDLSGAAGLTEIGEDCFRDCERLNSVKLPESVGNIGDGAFKGCQPGLTVKIPSMTTTINVDAFDDYDALKENEYWIQTPKDSFSYKRTKESGYGPAHIHWIPLSNITVRFWKNKDAINDELFDSSALCVQTFETSPVSIGYPDTSNTPNFKEWACKVNGTTLYGTDVGTNITEDRDIYATYFDITHTVSFYQDNNWDLVEPPQTVADGDRARVPNERNLKTTLAERAGEEDKYEFAGWRCKAGGVEVGMDAIYSANITEDWVCMATFKLSSVPNTPTPTPDPNASPTPTTAPGTPTPTTKPGSTPTPTSAANPGTTSTPTPTTAGGSSSQNYTGKMYYAIVENGSGSGQYPAGSVVTVTAYAAPEGRTFDRWTTSNTDIGISNILAVSTTFIMPSHDVKVTATYKSKAVSGNYPTVVPGPAPTLAPGVTATPTPVVRNNGTDVIITTDNIDNNKKNLGNASVAGSTDNFIVKITDSAAATAAVESALRNAYGERFNDLRYAAFDISLYDSTGTYLVSNANSLAVTITMPLPEALLSYAGNNKAGAVINGQLQELATSYTTIDGVPCMRFTATHFSPYTIYVDTGHIVRGIVDNTPKTGDGIKPKWFLSGGMLSMSAVLFLWKEKNPIIAEEKRRKKKSSGR